MINSQNAVTDLKNIAGRQLTQNFEYDKALVDAKVKLVVIKDFLNSVSATLNVSNSLLYTLFKNSQKRNPLGWKPKENIKSTVKKIFEWYKD